VFGSQFLGLVQPLLLHASTPMVCSDAGFVLISYFILCLACLVVLSFDFLVSISKMMKSVQTHTHTCITALLPVLSGWAGTRKVKPIWILLKQETVSGSGISWVVCKSAPRCRQITMPATDHSVFYRPDALPAQPTASKHWRDKSVQKHGMIKLLNVKDMLKISAWKQNRKKWWKRTEKSWWNL